ncbi:MAG TPA: acetylornithine/succinylornithine family transaminase [archaeon]|nr:acetylornithine/succinylornithine family transaminase [archaeon]
METEKLKALHDRHEAGLYPMKKPVIVRGEGASLWDSEGREYVDCGASYGVCNAGHSNPFIVKAVQEQLERLSYIQGTYYTEQRALLVEKLSKLTGLEKSFLCNSGTEAVEAAIKMARASTGKKEVISTVSAFHGRTFGALSATWKEHYRKPFEPLVPGFKHVPFGNSEKLREAITSDTAAFIVEPIQGEGGVRIPSNEYLKEVREICSEKNVLLVFDEVQTGFCRTGAFFAKEHWRVQPDVLCMAKSIANGYPMGAISANDNVFKVEKLVHGTTFGGNPVACTASLATIEFMEKERLWEQASEKGEYFLDLLKGIQSSKVREARGKGLMVGLELKEKPQPYLEALAAEGVLALPAGTTVLRFLPPLIVSKEQLRIAYEKTSKVLA